MNNQLRRNGIIATKFPIAIGSCVDLVYGCEAPWVELESCYTNEGYCWKYHVQIAVERGLLLFYTELELLRFIIQHGAEVFK